MHKFTDIMNSVYRFTMPEIMAFMMASYLIPFILGCTARVIGLTFPWNYIAVFGLTIPALYYVYLWLDRTRENK